MLTVPSFTSSKDSTVSILLKNFVCLVTLFLVFGFSSGNIVNTQEHDPTSSNRGTFSLVDHFGRTVTEQTYRGSYLLIFFGYSHCPDICPISLSIFTQVLEQLEEKADMVQPLFITLDPERDTPERLARFVTFFHPRLIGLTGSVDQIATVAKKYFVRYEKYSLKTPPTALENSYLLDHTGASYLLGPDGEGLSLFPHDTTADDIALTILSFMD